MGRQGVRALRAASAVAIWTAATLLAGGTLGALHPAGDSLAVFRVPLAIVLLAAAALAGIAGRRTLGALAAAAGAAALAGPLAAHVVQPHPGPFVVYQKNLSATLRDISTLARDIEASDADAVLLQEVAPSNEALLARLASRYPAQMRCASQWLGDTAVLSRHAPVPGAQGCVHEAAVLRLSSAGGPLWLVSMHWRWPWPIDQAAQADALSGALGALDGSIVLGGDLNMVPWSHAVRHLARVTGTRSAGPPRATLRVAGVPLSIDHVLAPGPGPTERRARLGSDHHGVVARAEAFGARLSAPSAPRRTDTRSGSRGRPR